MSDNGAGWDAEAISRRLGALQANLGREAGDALYQEGEIERREMVQRTPVEFGALRASIVLVGPEFSGRDISCRIDAGGPSAPYAIYVHEDLEAFHPVGQAKFIESVLLESAPYMGERVARRIDLNRAMGRG